MPGRYLNFGAMTFVAMLIGLLGSRRAALEPRRALLPVAAACSSAITACCGNFSSTITTFIYQSPVRPLSIVWMATAALLAGAAWTAQRAESRAARCRRTYCARSHPCAPIAPRCAGPRRADDHASARRSIGRAFQRSHQRRVLRRRRRAAEACCSSPAICTSFNCARGVRFCSTQARSIP